MSARSSTQVSLPWNILFFQRHEDADPARTVPARDFLAACPPNIEAKILAVVKAVADAPPPTFSGGGMWEAMHGDLAGIYEVRVNGPRRRHYRLFCILEREGASVGLGAPSIVLLTGKKKAFGTRLPAKDYAKVRALREEYLSRSPRCVLK